MNKPKVNNDYYNHLGDLWYQADNDPIAILRAEQKVKNPWVDKIIQSHFANCEIDITDVGCGAGFLSNFLATKYSNVHGVDASESSLEVAKKNDKTQKVNYIVSDAYRLPFEDNSMDVVCAMDFLEHVDNPEKVISECARVLRANGLFFYHTFNRNFLSWLIVIKFMEWFVPNTPKNLHVLHLFITPMELMEMMQSNGLKNIETLGLRPCLNFSFLKSLFKRSVLPGFNFRLTKNTTLGYLGVAKKSGKSIKIG